MVWRFLGKPMSEENLKQLAKNDNLDIMYEDRRLPERERVLTRSTAQSQLQTALSSDLVAAASDNITVEEEQELGSNPTNNTRSVSFGRDLCRCWTWVRRLSCPFVVFLTRYHVIGQRSQTHRSGCRIIDKQEWKKSQCKRMTNDYFVYICML